MCFDFYFLFEGQGDFNQDVNLKYPGLFFFFVRNNVKIIYEVSVNIRITNEMEEEKIKPSFIRR